MGMGRFYLGGFNLGYGPLRMGHMEVRYQVITLQFLQFRVDSAVAQ